MIAYLLLVHISRMFSSMPGLAGGIARDIREGTLKKYLLQPIDMIGYLLSYRVAHKVGVHRHVGAALRAAVLPLPRLTSTASPTDLTLAAYVAVAGPGVPGRLLLRGLRRHGRLLVPGSDVAPLHRDDT